MNDDEPFSLWKSQNPYLLQHLLSSFQATVMRRATVAFRQMYNIVHRQTHDQNEIQGF